MTTYSVQYAYNHIHGTLKSCKRQILMMKCLQACQLFCVNYSCLRVCCEASVASPSPPVIRVPCVRSTQEGEGCGGLPFLMRSSPFTSSNCRDRRSRSSAAYTHSESMTCYAFGTRRLLYTVSWDGIQSLSVFALICSFLSVSRLDVC